MNKIQLIAKIAKRKWWILIGISTCISMLYIDQTAVSVMLPQLKLTFGASDVAEEWVINALLLSTAVLITAGGRLSDIWGARRSFLIGTIGFFVASALCGAAPNISLLIIGRFLQGVFSAILLPATTVNVINAFPSRQVGSAMGIYVGGASIFLVLGPLLGGFFTQYLSWRYIFWFNIPLVCVSLFIANFSLRKGKPKNLQKPNKKNNSFDWPSFIALGLANTALVTSLMESTRFGWKSPFILSLVVIAILGYVAFSFFNKRQKKTPLVDFSIFNQKNYAICIIIMACMQFCIITRIFMIILFQLVSGYSPLHASLLIVPTTLPVIFMAPIAGRMLTKYGARVPIILGTVLVTISLFWLVFFIRNNNYPLLVTGLLLFGMGMPLALNPALTTALSSVAKNKRGIASGVINQVRQISGTLAVAIIGVIINHVSQYNLANFIDSLGIKYNFLYDFSVTDILMSTNAAQKALMRLPNYLQEQIHFVAVAAYSNGFRFAMAVTAIAVMGAMVFAILRLGKGK